MARRHRGGAQPQREPPYDKAVFNVRASYRDETRAMVDAFFAMGKKRIGIFVQDDAYGASGRAGVKRGSRSPGRWLGPWCCDR